jgi:hypothetical protein
MTFFISCVLCHKVSCWIYLHVFGKNVHCFWLLLVIILFYCINRFTDYKGKSVESWILFCFIAKFTCFVINSYSWNDIIVRAAFTILLQFHDPGVSLLQLSHYNVTFFQLQDITSKTVLLHLEHSTVCHLRTLGFVFTTLRTTVNVNSLGTWLLFQHIKNMLFFFYNSRDLICRPFLQSRALK